MSPRGQAATAGFVVGAVTFAGCFYFWIQRKQADLAHIGQNLAPAIAEQAVKDYIATNYGMTPERLRAAMGHIRAVQGSLGPILSASILR